MSDELFASPMSLLFTPVDGEAMEVCRFAQPLLAAPEEGWEHRTQEGDRLCAVWGNDFAVGNVRRSLRVQVVVCDECLPAGFARMRRMELRANLCRLGSLLWQECYVEGVPSFRQRWRALLMGCSARRAEPGEFALPGAVGVMEWEFRLSEPVEL